ncbi:MAG: acyl-CoA synthetases (AMP-forming)/AMP-acid ligases II [halophilic archaeon J07HX64]|jgi:Acyl-CoA synthetases (AMP-forming)/AMP-acid ligases II|nr:MAG: acyl-CoA synthetases (AMP-forming)/AMP-acid ligases II [halophilic archaeon J07HX64]
MDVLARRVAATPDRTALVDARDSRRWSYRHLDALVDRAAERLRERAPAVGRVGTLFTPGPAFVATFHAAQRLGSTVVGLDTRLGGADLSAHVRRAGVDCLVSGPQTTVPGSVETPVVVVPEPPAGDDIPGETNQTANSGQPVERNIAGGTDQTVNSGQPVEGVAGPGPDDPAETAVVLFTSGTTGRPKGVRLTAGNLHASAVASAFRLGVSPGDRWLCCLPVNHVGGLAPVLRTAMYGTTLVVQRGFDAERTGGALAAHGVTGVSLVPTQLRRLLDVGAPLSELSAVLVGGAPTPERLLDRALAADVPVHPTYGLTETASQVATARPAGARDHPASVGQPLYGVRVTVVADGSPVETGERGEIVVAGPTVTPGYLDSETTGAAIGEWGLHTGDVGVRDGAGRLRVLGRRDEMVLTGGELVAPREVVETLRSHPAVADAAVVGLPDEEWGERVAALVVPENGDEDDGTLDVGTVRAHCRDSLPGYKRPKTVALVDTLPRTVSGTVDREAVRARLRSA